MIKQTTITIETNSLLVLRGRGLNRAWCPACGTEGMMIELEALETVANPDPPAFEAWLNPDELHRSKASDGSPLICLRSLLAGMLNTAPANRLIARLQTAQKEKL